MIESDLTKYGTAVTSAYPKVSEKLQTLKSTFYKNGIALLNVDGVASSFPVLAYGPIRADEEAPSNTAVDVVIPPKDFRTLVYDLSLFYANSPSISAEYVQTEEDGFQRCLGGIASSFPQLNHFTHDRFIYFVDWLDRFTDLCIATGRVVPNERNNYAIIFKKKQNSPAHGEVIGFGAIPITAPEKPNLAYNLATMLGTPTQPFNMERYLTKPTITIPK